MIDKKTLKKISLAILIPLSIVLVTFTISTVLILNTNYIETGILKEQTDKYRFLADDFSNQIISAESILIKLETNENISLILNTEHLSSDSITNLYDAIDFNQIFENTTEESAFEHLTMYTTNQTVVSNPKIVYISPEIAAENWYNIIIQSRRNWLLTFIEDEAFILYKMTIPNNVDEYINIGVINLDLSSLIHTTLDQYKIMFSNVASSNIIEISGDRILNYPIIHYMGISESMYLDDEMVLTYTIIQGTSVTRWSLVIVIERTNFIYEFITYAIAILSIFSAIGFMFFYRLKYIRRIGKSFDDLSDDNIETIITANNPSQIEQIIQNLYTKVETLVKRNQELDILNQQKEAQKNEAEIKALLSQISPHYIFNLLNSIHKRALKNNETESAKMILLMSKQLRRSLEWKNPFVTIKEELDHIKSYILLQQYYHAIEYQFDYDLDESLCEVRIPKLILQTLIENALKHGVQTKPFRIKLDEKDNKIRFAIENEIEGNEKEIQERIQKALNTSSINGENEGIGLQNMVKRLKYYYGDAYQVTTRTGKKTILIRIEFPK